MKLIMQPTALTCGQACIAMIAGEYTHGRITSFLEIYAD